MAGIGFELKKIYKKEGIRSAIMGATYGSIVTVGPTILVILVILILYAILGFSSVNVADRELLSSTILYIFIFATILTSPYNTVFSRYIADKTFEEKTEDIFPSYYTGVAFVSLLATLIAIPVMYSLYVRGNVDLVYICISYFFWISNVILFFSIIYVHATSDYRIVMIFFVVGMTVAILVSLLLCFVFYVEIVYGILIGLTTGFFTISVLEFSYIKKWFHTASKNYFECLTYLWKHSGLFWANILYTLGLYVHNFIFWFTSMGIVVAETFYSNPTYDMATFLALLTNISTSVTFTILAETRFHETYHDYMQAVIGGTYRLIDKNDKIMFRTLSQQLSHIFGMQIAITCILYLVIVITVPLLGFNMVILKIYPILAASYLGVYLINANSIYLYYFSDDRGSLMSSLTFFVTTTIGAWVSRNFDMQFYGVGCLVGVLCGLTYSFRRIQYMERNIESHLFCGMKILNERKGTQRNAVVYTNPKALKSKERK